MARRPADTSLADTSLADTALARTMLAHATLAELVKLRTLPAAVWTVAVTVLGAALLGATLAASAADAAIAVSAPDIVSRAVPFLQVGTVLLGIWPVAQEYAGRQVGTTLAAVPGRIRLVTAKSAAALIVLAVSATATVAACVVTAVLTQRLLDAPVPAGTGVGHIAAGWEPAGAVAYLTLIGLLAHAVALLVRHLIPALVGMLTVLLIASPLLAGITEHARWLPDRAGMRLYGSGDAVLGAATGALVLVGWVVLVGAVGVIGFRRRDA